MFLFLHRMVKACILAVFLAAGWWLWLERERLMPAVEFAELWMHRDTEAPAELIRIEGQVASVPIETGIYLKDGGGKLWFCSFVGTIGVMPQDRIALHPEVQFVRETLTNQTALLKGREVVFVASATTPLRSATGYLELEGTNVNVRMLEEGRLSLNREAIRKLPVMDQYAMVAAERRARRAGTDRWAADLPPPKSTVATR